MLSTQLNAIKFVFKEDDGILILLKVFTYDEGKL